MRLTVAQARSCFPELQLPKLKTLARAKSCAEERFALQCLTEPIPQPVREHLFALELNRRWRFDFAWIDSRCAVEIEGLRKKFIDGVPYAVGRHCTFSGFQEDCVKYANAAILGWRVLRFNQALVRDGTAIALTRRLLASRGVGA